jgi:Fur family peroxide stress response transcriptional regulator
MRKIHWTPQRRAVYEVVKEARDHPTAAMIMDRLHERGQRFAYATVYNSLRYLSDAGIIRELRLGEGASRYDGRSEDHQHIVCDVCGAIEEVFEPVPQAWQDAVSKTTGFTLSGVQVVLHGVCPSCQRQPRNASESGTGR